MTALALRVSLETGGEEDTEVRHRHSHIVIPSELSGSSKHSQLIVFLPSVVRAEGIILTAHLTVPLLKFRLFLKVFLVFNVLH